MPPSPILSRQQHSQIMTAETSTVTDSSRALALLTDIAALLAEGGAVDSVISVIVNQIADAFDFAACSLSVLSDDENDLIRIATTAPQAPPLTIKTWTHPAA